ncbi:hypothetical protein, partial [Aerococcus viridans]|uniref:hypothetical protein n=1 Tax=Aerococcus viridans TaxID=1377 RepID=UPI001B7FD4C8
SFRFTNKRRWRLDKPKPYESLPYLSKQTSSEFARHKKSQQKSKKFNKKGDRNGNYQRATFTGKRET